MERFEAMEAARRVVEERYPECDAALLAGSVVRGQATETSDLDLVAVTTRAEAPFRESFVAHGWPVEAFVHTRASLSRFFASDAKSRMPSLPAMCAEGVVIRGRDGQADEIKAEARELIERGPEPLTAEEIEAARYALTDRLDDFLGDPHRGEGIFVAAELATMAAEFVLAYNRRWSGRGKWLARALRRFDPEAERRLTKALEDYCHSGRKAELAALVEGALAPVGGRLFAGYRRSGEQVRGTAEGAKVGREV